MIDGTAAFERRRVAILAADVSKYARHMGLDESRKPNVRVPSVDCVDLIRHHGDALDQAERTGSGGSSAR